MQHTGPHPRPCRPSPPARLQLCAKNFARCILNVPVGSDWQTAARVVGTQYPMSVFCPKALFDQGRTAAQGAQLCYAAAARSFAAEGRQTAVGDDSSRHS